MLRIDVDLEHSNHIVKVSIDAICSQFKPYNERHSRTCRTIWNYATGTLTPSKGPDTMLKWIVLSISTVGKCGPMQVVKQPEQWKALITEKQNCSSSQANYD